MPTISLTNGAAHWGMACLTNAKCSLADLFTSGSLAKKLRTAAGVPGQEKDEAPTAYQERVAIWMDEPFGELEISQEERDYTRAMLKGMGERKELPANYHMAALAKAFELDKP